MAKSEVTGGMSKNWLSDIAGSSEVRRAIGETGTQAKRLAETRTKDVRSRRKGKSYHYRWYYGSTTLEGKWGNTVLIWGMNPASKTRPDILRKSARDAGTKEKGGS